MSEAVVKKATRVAYGEALNALAPNHPEIVVLDADLAAATMTGMFKKEHPENFYDMGIAEANMVDVAAGMSTMGLVPFCSTFAVFAGRCYDQIRNGVCYPKLNVKFAFSHAGISVGEDGGTHQAIEDLALMRALPNMTVLVPADATEMQKVVEAALAINGPVYIRTARLATTVMPEVPFEVGKGTVLREGKDAVVFACGMMVEVSLEAAAILAKDGIELTVVNMASLKPFDNGLARELAEKLGKVFTVEEHSVIGGLGDAVAAAICGVGLKAFDKIGVEDVFGQSGKPADLFKEYGLTAEQIAERIRKQI